MTGKWEYYYTTGSLMDTNKIDSWAYTYGDTSWGDRLTKYDGKTLNYDEIGNLTSDGGTWSYTWQGGRQLAGMTKTGTTLAFDYNEAGLRTAKTVGSTTTYYTYIGSQLTSETTGTATMYFYYDANGAPVGMKYNGELYFYMKNIQGDIIGIVNTDGTLIVEYEYDAWGNPLSTTGTSASTVGAANPLRYRGYYYDEETGLYYLQSRYYNPSWGRFINADGYAQTTVDSLGANMFAYCGNNPVMFSDPSGHFGLAEACVAGAIIGALGAAPALTPYYNQLVEYSDQLLDSAKELYDSICRTIENEINRPRYYLAECTFPGAIVHLDIELNEAVAAVMLVSGWDVYTAYENDAIYLCQLAGTDIPISSESEKCVYNVKHYHPAKDGKRLKLGRKGGHCFYGTDGNLKYIMLNFGW